MNQKYCLSFGALIVITLITMKSGLDFTDKLGSGDATGIDSDFYENGDSIVIENDAETKTLRRRVKGSTLDFGKLSLKASSWLPSWQINKTKCPIDMIAQTDFHG